MKCTIYVDDRRDTRGNKFSIVQDSAHSQHVQVSPNETGIATDIR